jgi:Major Facilitator Superfamily
MVSGGLSIWTLMVIHWYFVSLVLVHASAFIKHNRLVPSTIKAIQINPNDHYNNIYLLQSAVTNSVVHARTSVRTKNNHQLALSYQSTITTTKTTTSASLSSFVSSQQHSTLSKSKQQQDFFRGYFVERSNCRGRGNSYYQQYRHHAACTQLFAGSRSRGTDPNNSDDNEIIQLTKDTKPRVYKQRWIQLGYLSILALLSDWICFSVAAVPTVYENAFPTHTAASIIDLFLFTNVVSCFVVTDIVRRIGLQKAIQYSSALMMIGCWLRCGGLAFMGSEPSTVTTYPYIVIGTVLVGFSQPFFQCTPPLLSATWFASTERATSTAIALNFNQIGIAVAFLVGGSMAINSTGLENYFGLIAILCTIVTAGTFLQFQNEPPIPPSQSELEKKVANKAEPPFLTSVQSFFQKNGFTQALVA